MQRCGAANRNRSLITLDSRRVRREELFFLFFSPRPLHENLGRGNVAKQQNFSGWQDGLRGCEETDFPPCHSWFHSFGFA